MPFRRSVFTCIAALALAGCGAVAGLVDDFEDDEGGGGSGDGSASFRPIPPRPDDFGSFAEAQALLSQFEPRALIPEGPLEANLTGTATYAGAVGFERPGVPNPELIGKLTMEVDLGNRFLLGKADNFVSQNDEPVNGLVLFNSGTISPNGQFQIPSVRVFTGDPNFVSETVAQGRFHGENAEQLSGDFAFSDGSQNWIGRMGAARQ